MADIIFESVTFSYPGTERNILRKIDLEFQRGEYTAIAGANGSGKTTLLRHLNGILVPNNGNVLIEELNTKRPENIPEIRTLLGMMFQFPEDQIIGSTVYEDCAFGPENLGLIREDTAQRVEESLRKVSLWFERDRPPHRLSAGQQQRLALAGVLAMGTRYLAIDEGTIMLDPRGKDEFLSILKELNSAGHTIIAVTQNMEEFLQAERGIVIASGAVAADGNPEEIILSRDLPSRGLLPPPRIKLSLALARYFPDFSPPKKEYKEIAAALDSLAENPGQKGAERNNKHKSGGDKAPMQITVEGVSHCYLPGTELERTAIKDLSFAVPEGKTLAILGATGSGKTTILHLLAGLIPLQTGTIDVSGINLTDKKYDVVKLRRTVGLLMQRPEDQLFEDYVTDDIAYGPAALGVKGRELKKRVYDAMQQSGISYPVFKDRRIKTLSGGEQRKVGIAGVLAMESSILLLDEPTSGLDPVSRGETITLLNSLKDQGKTIVLVTHDMDILPKIADYILILEGGQNIFFGEALEGYRHLCRTENTLRCPGIVKTALFLEERGRPSLENYPLDDEEEFAAYIALGKQYE